MGCGCGHKKKISKLAKIKNNIMEKYKWAKGITENSTITHHRHKVKVAECTQEHMEALYKEGCKYVEKTSKDAKEKTK